MTPEASAAIGNITVVVIFLVVVFTVIGVGFVVWVFCGWLHDKYDQWRVRRILARRTRS